MRKRILTIEDLLSVCKERSLATFSAKDSGYSIAVQMPSTFEVDEYDSQEGMLKMNIKAFHTGKNLNQSYISVENAKKCMSSMKLRPILGTIHQLSDGTWDFKSHDMEVVEEDGELKINYIEKQVGSFTEDEPFLMQDEQDENKYFVCSKIVIPEDYTRAADILKEKESVKVSVELDIKSFSFNSKEDCLEIEDFIVTGCTLLGSYEDSNGKVIQVQEGMAGSKATLEDFSVDKNSKFSNMDLEETTVKTSASGKEGCFDKQEKKGGSGDMSKLQELLEKYSKTIDELDFDYESMTDEELETKFAEIFGEDGGADTSATEETGEDEQEDAGVEEESHEEETAEEPETENARVINELEDGSVQITYSLSHKDIRTGLYKLIQAFEIEDSRFYDIISVYDDYFVFGDSWTDVYYGCPYTKEDDVLALGERYSLHKVFLTDAEKDAMDALKANYESVKSELESYKANELKAQKEEVLSDEAYSQYAKEKEFAELREHMDDFTLEEFKDKANIAFANCVKRSGKFSVKHGDTKPEKTGLFKNFEKETESRYGSIFKK